MKILLKNFPYGSLPYTNLDGVVKMMLKLYEQCPYLPFLPKIEENDIYKRTLCGIPGIKANGDKYILENTSKDFPQYMVKLEQDFKNEKNLNNYGFSSAFLDKYLKIIERNKPKETIVNFLGPFSISQVLQASDESCILEDSCYKKFIILFLCLKAMWIIKKIKSLSEETTPIIVLEEPLLNNAGLVKRQKEDVTQEIIIGLFSSVISKIKSKRAAVCVHCFEKCDWQIPIEAGADMISFDAYNNPNNLNIIPEKVNNFLIGGGHINWAIVPAPSEQFMKTLTVDNIYDKYMNRINGLIESGVSERLVYANSSISVNTDLDNLPLIFAEKAIILSSNATKKIPRIPPRPQPIDL